MSKIRLRYVGSFGHKSGYAQATQDYLLALHRAGVDLDISPILEPDPTWRAERYEPLLPLVNRADAAHATWPTHVIVHTIPLGLKVVLEEENVASDAKRIAMTTWETSKFPDEAANDLRAHFDAVWVPSQYSADAIRRARVPAEKVQVVWHTFDPEVWWPNKWTRKVLAEDPGPYTFYSILTWCERKNPIGLLKAYLTEFTKRDDVLLRIKTPGWNKGEIEELQRGLGLAYLPPVDIVTEHLSADDMRLFHLRSDCYVTCARAEGWGLGAFEALLVGNPVIATDYSGLKEFCDEAHGVEPVPCFMTPAVTPETLANSTMKVAGLSVQAVNRNDHYGIRGDQEWAEPDLGTVKQLMRWLYTERAGKTDRNMKWMAECFGYENVAARMVQLMEAM